MKLDNIKLRLPVLTNEIFLIRHGKNENEALDRRVMTQECLSAVTELMMKDAPKGSIRVYGWGEQRFKMTVVPMTKEEAEEFNKQKEVKTDI